MGEETARLRQQIDQTRRDLTRDVDLLADRTSPSRMVERRVERARSGLVGLKERVMGSETSDGPRHLGNGDGDGTSVRDTVGNAVSTDRVHDVASGVRDQTQGNPLAAGVIAFGIGWLVSSLLPASDAETKAAQRAGDLAREHAGPVVDQAKQAAQEVGHDLQGSARSAAAQVKERAQDAAGTVREQAHSSMTT